MPLCNPMVVIYSGELGGPFCSKCQCLREIFAVPAESLSKEEVSSTYVMSVIITYFRKLLQGMMLINIRVFG